MNLWFLASCFLVGVSASSTMGPVFILTFNNSALRGFMRGLATAIGSAAADGVLMFLGFMGILKFLENSHKYQLLIDLTGGFFLVLFGLFLLTQQKENSRQYPRTSDSLVLSGIKAFSLTAFNPLTMLFFIFASTQVLQTGAGSHTITTKTLIGGSLFASAGSFCMLGAVAYAGSLLGKAIKPKALRTISVVTGFVIIGVGIYFFADALHILLVKS